MKRPFTFCSLFFIAGIIAARWHEKTMLPIFVAIIALLGIYIFYRIYGSKSFLFVFMLVFFAAGYILFSWKDISLGKKYIEFDGKEVCIYGKVVEEAERSGSGPVYIVRSSRIAANNCTYEVRGLIRVTSAGNTDNLLPYGSQIKFEGILKLPRGGRNPGGFDYCRYLKGKNISALVYTYNITKLGSRRGFSLKASALTVRHRIITVSEKCLPAKEAGLLNGMLIGYRDGLDEDMQNAFSDAGLTHIMAVSGANVLFVAMPFIYIFKKLRIGRRASSLIVTGILIFFVFITGFSPSVVRATVMAVVMLLGKVFYRETEVVTSISFSAFLLLAINPFLLYDIGFQLSYAATLSLVFLNNPVKQLISLKFVPEAVSEIIAATLAAQMGVLPVSTWYFNKISLVSLISNLLVIPLVQLVTILGTIMSVAGQLSPLLAKVPAMLNYLPLAFILKAAEFCSLLPYAVITVPTPRPYVIAGYYAVLYLFYRRMNGRPRLIGVKPEYKVFAIIVLVIVISLYKALIPGKLEVLFMDVGEGDAILVRTAEGRNILLDGGGSAGGASRNDTGRNIVIPLLLDYGIVRLDMVIASHPHGDHVQGLIPVMEQFHTGRLIIPDNSLASKDFKELLTVAAKRQIPVSTCSKGDFIDLEKDTGLLVLHPDKTRPISDSVPNNASLVLKLVFRNIKILLTGDIEREAEAMMIEGGEDLTSHFLKLPHHGSSTSTTAAFLDKVRPSAAVISVGPNNFGHPSKQVVKRMKALGASLYRTDIHGAVKLVTDGRKIEVTTTIKK